MRSYFFETAINLVIAVLVVGFMFTEVACLYNSISTKIHRKNHAKEIGCEYLGNSDNAPKVAFYQCNGELVTKIEDYPN